MAVARDCREKRGMRSYCLMDTEFQVEKMQTVMEIGSGDSCTTM
jgi:hypothetical protein